MTVTARLRDFGENGRPKRGLTRHTVLPGVALLTFIALGIYLSRPQQSSPPNKESNAQNGPLKLPHSPLHRGNYPPTSKSTEFPEIAAVKSIASGHSALSSVLDQIPDDVMIRSISNGDNNMKWMRLGLSASEVVFVEKEILELARQIFSLFYSHTEIDYLRNDPEKGILAFHTIPFDSRSTLAGFQDKMRARFGSDRGQAVAKSALNNPKAYSDFGKAETVILFGPPVDQEQRQWHIAKSDPTNGVTFTSIEADRIETSIRYVGPLLHAYLQSRQED